jgi:PAS domain S-box-containing protein
MSDQFKTKKTLIQKNDSLDEASEYAESIIDTVREPLIVLDQDLRVVTASRSFYEFFKVKPEDIVGQLIYDLGNKQWDIPKLRELLETILPEKATFDNYEVEHDFATIGRRIMLLNARQIKRVFGKERIILLAIEDITEHKRLENLLTESEERYRHLVETARDGIVLLEKREGKITQTNPASEKRLGYSSVVFALDEPRYALPLSVVERVVRSVEITPLPNAPAIVQGAINVQGKIIPVVNIRERLQLPAREINCNDHFIIARTQRRNVALVSDYVAGIRELADGETEITRQSLPFVEYLHGVAKIEDNLILIYDLDAFLSLDEEQMLDNAIAGDTP